MARDDPFSGIKLSEQAELGKIEQRLFAPQAPQTTSETPKPEPRQAAEPKATVTVGNPPPTSLNKASSVNAVLPPMPRFDLREVALYKACFVFTQEELEALEDLKLELRREYDTKVTKNDLIRSALHLLLEDHAASPARSYASRKIRKH